MLLFLDYDGVLHPDEVYLKRGRPVLRGPGELFMWVPHLLSAIEGADVRIVLSTSWARHLGFRRACNALPESLRGLVVGATWHSKMKIGESGAATLWDLQTRYEQIQAYLAQMNSPCDWLAIDDDARGWPDEKLPQLIHADPALGLSCEQTAQRLRERLLHGC